TLHEGRIRCDLARFVRAIHSSPVLCVGTHHHVQMSNYDCASQISNRNSVLLSSEVHDTWAPSGRRRRLVSARCPAQRLHPKPHFRRILLHLQRRYVLSPPRPDNVVLFVGRFGVKKKFSFVCEQRHTPVMIQMFFREFDTLLLLLRKEERLFLGTKRLQSLC